MRLVPMSEDQMVTRTERLLALLQILRSNRVPVTAAALAGELAVSERTIYRDIATLAAQGAAISGEGGLGYVLRGEYFLPPLAFDKEEAAAILLGLRFVLQRGDDALVTAARSARGKLAAVTPRHFSAADDLGAPLLVGPERSKRVQTLEAVRDAVSRERKLAIDYVDMSASLSSRTIWPLAIGWFDECEILAAWCEMRAAFRHFRVDRLQRVDIVDERPAVPRNILLSRYRKLEQGIEL